MRDWIVIQSVASGTTLNGYAISGTGTNITLGNKNNGTAFDMAWGTADPANPLTYECDYDFTNDILYRLFDPIYNNEIIQDSNFQSENNGSSILNFNWNQANVYNNRFYNTVIYPNFLDSTSKFYSNEAMESIIGANMLQDASLVYEQRLKTAEFQQNRFKSGSICMGNELVAGFGWDHRPPPQGGFQLESSVFKFNKFDNSKVTSNKIYGGAWFKYNEFSSNGFFTSNKMTWFSEFSCNTCTGSRFYNSRIAGWFCFAKNTFAYSYLYDVYFLDDSFIINITINNSIINDGLMVNVALDTLTLNYNIWVIGFVTGIVATNLSYGGNSPNEHFIFEPSGNRNKTFSYEIQFDGTTGHGASGDVINLIPLRAGQKVYNGLTSNLSLNTTGSPQIKIGITDHDSCILPLRSISSLTSNVINILTPTPTKAISDPTAVFLTITGGSLTSGYLQIALDIYG